jgi:hypothetical protein
VTERDFADPARAVEDMASLAEIRRSLADRMRGASPEGAWFESDESHWLVVPDAGALARTRPAVGVGFFGRARKQVDHAPIHHLERELLSRASTFSGLLAYCNVRFGTGQWGNLVLFADDASPAHVRTDPTHLEALALTPAHYSSVRLHRVRFPDGALGEAPAELVSTLLIDLDETPPWRAVRTFS